jgi:predicted ArsR family transcriptional regulator
LRGCLRQAPPDHAGPSQGPQRRHDLSIRLGIPANTVKTHLRQALLELRTTMFASIEARTHSAA